MINYISKHITKTACLFTIAAGFLVLAGWFFNIPAFKSILPGIVSMKFNTAVCIILSGVALYLIHTAAGGQLKKTVTSICSWIVLLAGFLNLMEYLTGYNLGIDELLWKEGPGTVATIFPGRMSMSTSINFILFGFIFLILGKGKFHGLIQALLIFMLTGSLLVTFNHIFGGTFLIAVPQISNTALPTAILFTLLCFGIFHSRPLEHLSFSFQKKIAGFFAMVTLMLVMVFFAISENDERSANTAKGVNQTHEVLLLVEKINSEANKMQSGARGYIIAGQEDYLPLFVSSADTVNNMIHRLSVLLKDESGQRLRIDTLEKLLYTYISHRKELINIRRENGFEAAQKIFISDEGKITLDKVRSIIAAIQQEENKLLAKRKNESEQSIKNSYRVITLFEIIAVFLLLVALILIYKNIRKRNKAEEQLKEYKYFFDHSNDLCLIANKQGYFETITPRVAEVLGYTNGEITKTPFIELVHPDDIASTLLEYDELKAGATVINFVNRYRKKDGTYLWLDWNASPNPATHNLYCIARDITERKRLEDKLKQFNVELEQRVKDRTKELSNSEKRFRALIENSSDAISLVDASAKVIYQSPAADSITGFSFEDRDGESGFVHIHPDDVDKAKKIYTELLEQPGTAVPMLFRAIHQKGHYIWLEGTATNLLHEEAVKAIVINFRDATERKKAQEALIRSEAEYRHLFQQSPLPMWIYEPSTYKIYNVNEASITHYGYTEDEFLNMSLKDIRPEDQVEKFITCTSQTAVGYNESGGWKHRKKDGTLIDVEIRSHDILFGTKACRLVMITDVTEKLKAEEQLKSYAAELLASNTELERFAYIASHDLQEPLRMVSSFMGLLEEGLDGQLDETNKQFLDFAVDGAERMKIMIQDLLLYSRVGTNKEDFAQTDLNEVMQYSIRVLKEDIIKTRAVLTVNPMPVITGNNNLITRLFINLVNNALKYKGDKAPIIEVGYTEDTGEFIFYVKDNGIGIHPEFFDKIFIIFQRLHGKTEYSGTGIGLAVCKKIVELHKGKIWIESEPGKGSTFYFSIPKYII